MARKKESKVPAVSTEKKSVRLELSDAVYQRLVAIGDEMDRSLSYVARLAVSEWTENRLKPPASPAHKPVPGQGDLFPGKAKGRSDRASGTTGAKAP